MRQLNRLSVYILKRYLLLLLGLSIMAFGVAFSIKASLGTSPISSVPYVVSLFAPLTVGTATIIMHCVFIIMLDFNPEERLSSDPVNAASGCSFSSAI